MNYAELQGKHDALLEELEKSNLARKRLAAENAKLLYINDRLQLDLTNMRGLLETAVVEVEQASQVQAQMVDALTALKNAGALTEEIGRGKEGFEAQQLALAALTAAGAQ